MSYPELQSNGTIPILKNLIQTSPDQIEPLRKQTSLGNFFESVNQHATNLYLTTTNNELSRLKAPLEQGVDQEKIEKVLINQDFQGTDPDTEEYQQLLQIASLKEKIGRTIIREIVAGENQLGLSEVERIILLASCDLSDQFDQLYFEFHDHIVKGPTAQTLQQMDVDQNKELISQAPSPQSPYWYHTYEMDDNDQLQPVAYGEIFSQPVGEINTILASLVQQLNESSDTQAQPLATYYEGFRQALTSTNIAEHEQLWKAVDVAWMKISARMQPIHMMEVYADTALGRRVNPEYALCFIDDRYQQVNDLTDLTKQKMIRWLQQEFTDNNSLTSSVPAMQNSQVGVFATTVSGHRLDFRPAGQNIPNREDVRSEHGVKIFMDMKTMSMRWQAQIELLTKIFGSDFVQQEFSNPMITAYAAGVRVAGHEVAHNAFIKPGTSIQLGPENYNQIEEHKADLIAVITAFKSLNQEEQVLFLKSLLGANLRALSMRNDQTFHPYYNSTLFILNMMNQLEILAVDAGQSYSLDLSHEKLSLMAIKAESHLKEKLVPLYSNPNQGEAKSYQDSAFIETLFITGLLNKLDITT